MSTNRYCDCPKCGVVFRLPAGLVAGLTDEKRNQSAETVRCGVCHAVFNVDSNLMRQTDNGFIASAPNHGIDKETVSHSGNASENTNSNSGSSPAGQVERTHQHKQPANRLAEICIDDIENPFEERVPYSLNLHEDDEPTAVDGEPFRSLAMSSAESNPSEARKYKIAQHINRTHPVMTFLWFVVAVGLVLLLGAQAKHFLVPQYAQDETYREYIVHFCQLAGCELPPRQNPFLFTLIHTRIDLHPTEPGALKVTVKAVNQAKFSQPYPHVQLTLTDRVGRVVGRRTFSPDIYLPEGVNNMIEQGQLASITLNLARPHEKAVGFIVDIVSEPTVTAG